MVCYMMSFLTPNVSLALFMSYTLIARFVIVHLPVCLKVASAGVARSAILKTGRAVWHQNIGLKPNKYPVRLHDKA